MAEPAIVHADQKTKITRNAVTRLSSELGETLPLTRKRLDGWAAFQSTPVPDRVRHLWRYSDPNDFMPQNDAEWLSTKQDRSPAATAVSLTSSQSAAGITIEPLAQSDLAPAHLHRAVGTDFGLFESLNAATWQSGLAIRIPKGVECAEPLRVSIQANTPCSHSRLLIVVESGARAEIIQDFAASDQEAITNHVAEIIVEPGAAIDHLILGAQDEQARAHITIRAQIDRDGRYRQSIVSLGGKRIKADVGADLVGTGANSEIYGVAIGDKRRKFDHHTVHRHGAQHTWSNIDFKTALTGRAKAAYTGLIRIEEDADFTEAYQESRNLLLSERCHADTIPELEILTNEVRCTHGATSAPIDPAELFYLQSRGIDRQSAARMIVHGFFGEIFSKCPAASRAEIEKIVDQRLEQFQMGV